MSVIIKSHKTAITRNTHSLPIKLAIHDQIISASRDIFDYGCGKGDDVSFLKSRGISSSGWDPAHASDITCKPADVINLGYVINVIEDPHERVQTLKRAFELAKKILIVSALIDKESNRAERAVPHGDGIITSRGTFQKFYTQNELKDFIKENLDTDAVSAGLGVAYVFRDETERQLFLATRVRRAQYEKHETPLSLEEQYKEAKAVLEKFIKVIEYLGRIPDEDEFDATKELKAKLGSFSRAFNLIQHVFPNNLIEQRREQRINDLLVYLALSHFQNRPPLRFLPKTLQYDIRTFFGSYSKACKQADELLFLAGKAEVIDSACKQSKIGKLLPKALYIHRNYLSTLSPILRIYVGCAQVLVGEVENANIIKIHRNTGKVSYMVYGTFDKKAHPTLDEAVTVFLRTQGIRRRSYKEYENPLILHRKETFVLSDYPLYEKFKKLTIREEEAGLLDEPLGIGFRKQWEGRLTERGYKIRGHQLTSVKSSCVHALAS